VQVQRQIALLRGINVGRAKRIAMADLRKLIADLGYADVRTLLNSGNAVFASPGIAPEDTARRIEEALVLKLGVAARVTVLSAEELGQLVLDNTLMSLADDHSRLMAFVLSDARDLARLDGLLRRDWGDDAMALGARSVHLWCAGGILASEAAAALGKLLGDGVTSRNWATILKLHALATA